MTVEGFLKHFSDFNLATNIKVYSQIQHKHQIYPLVSVHFGNPKAATLLITGGVHGLEKIGAELCLSFLESFHQRLQWDNVAKNFLEHVQIVFIPVVNPVGYFETQRSNKDGIDLMRNAPLDAGSEVKSLLAGHRISPKLPWYRGTELATESLFLIDTVKNILTESQHLISLDLHSGFGFKDQIWFPYASSKKPFEQIVELHLLFKLFEKMNPYHVYQIEPQSKNYLTHGDLWDYCYLNLKKENQIFIPLTLEMGSWIWVKKNPLQLFSKTGLFNPIKQHRLFRTLRRHRPLFDFLIHSLISNQVWTNPEKLILDHVKNEALTKYYDHTK